MGSFASRAASHYQLRCDRDGPGCLAVGERCEYAAAWEGSRVSGRRLLGTRHRDRRTAGHVCVRQVSWAWAAQSARASESFREVQGGR